MWRLNWIRAFSDGNGRTARAVSYMLLCIKLGYVLPGSPAIPQQIEADKHDYLDALARADGAFGEGEIDVSDLEAMIRGMLAKQLISVIPAP